MSAPNAVEKILASIDKRVGKVAAFRATVTAVDGTLITIRREGATTPDTEEYATTARELIAVGDVVLCIPLGGKPVIIDVIRRAAASTPTGVLNAGAGSTATKTITGRDDEFELTISSAGTGQAIGSLIDITFAVARPSALYNVRLGPKNSAARGLGGVVGQSTTATTHVVIATNTALVAGSSYTWGVMVRQYG